MPYFQIRVMVKNEQLFTASHLAFFFYFVLDGELLVKVRQQNSYQLIKVLKHQFVGFQKNWRIPRRDLCIVASDTVEVVQIDTKKYLELKYIQKQRWVDFIDQNVPGFRFLSGEDKLLCNELKSVIYNKGEVLAYQGE